MSGLRLCRFCVAGGAFIIRGHIGRVPGHTVHPVCVMIVWCLHHTGFGACTTLALVHAPHWLWCMHHARFGACTMPGLVHAPNPVWCMHQTLLWCMHQTPALCRSKACMVHAPSAVHQALQWCMAHFPWCMAAQFLGHFTHLAFTLLLPIATISY